MRYTFTQSVRLDDIHRVKMFFAKLLDCYVCVDFHNFDSLIIEPYLTESMVVGL